MEKTARLVRIREKGQVTLPVSVRRSLNLNEGDFVSVEATNDGVLLRPQTVAPSASLPQMSDLPSAPAGAVLAEHEEFILPEPSAEDLARRRAAGAAIRALRERMPSIAPLTAADLVRMGREEEGANYDPGV